MTTWSPYRSCDIGYCDFAISATSALACAARTRWRSSSAGSFGEPSGTILKTGA